MCSLHRNLHNSSAREKEAGGNSQAVNDLPKSGGPDGRWSIAKPGCIQVPNGHCRPDGEGISGPRASCSPGSSCEPRMASSRVDRRI
jgi:hypothetical protein